MQTIKIQSEVFLRVNMGNGTTILPIERDLLLKIKAAQGGRTYQVNWGSNIDHDLSLIYRNL